MNVQEDFVVIAIGKMARWSQGDEEADHEEMRKYTKLILLLFV